jgi:hypothetical protein
VLAVQAGAVAVLPLALAVLEIKAHILQQKEIMVALALHHLHQAQGVAVEAAALVRLAQLLRRLLAATEETVRLPLYLEFLVITLAVVAVVEMPEEGQVVLVVARQVRLWLAPEYL